MNNIRIENVIHTELSQQMFASEMALAQSTEVHKKQTINMKKKTVREKSTFFYRSGNVSQLSYNMDRSRPVIFQIRIREASTNKEGRKKVLLQAINSISIELRFLVLTGCLEGVIENLPSENGRRELHIVN